MKKIALTALAAMIAATGFVSTASAGPRDNNDDWRRNSDRDRNWSDRRDGNRDARRHDDRADRRWDRDHRRDWRGGRDHWRPGYRHGYRPSVVFRYDSRPDYCFVKKVRRYDDWGNVYIKRVRVCR
jgi:Ni/Co efflux regulator RcnB